MNYPSSRIRIGAAAGVAAALVASLSFSQEAPAPAPAAETRPAGGISGADAPRDASQAVVIDQTPMRQPPTETGIDGKSVPKVVEKRVLADPATKRYMPCREQNDSSSDEKAEKGVKLNPKAAVLSEEAAKQHGYKPSPHKVDCPG